MHAGSVVFLRVTVERCGIDVGAVQRAHGMELILGGGQAGAVLADVLGPNDAIAKALDSVREVFVCQQCEFEPLACLLEHGREK